MHDDDNTPPWERSDGHGPVTAWTSRAKEPGELVLSKDRGSYRLYDFAEACKIARRDGWQPAPYRLDIERGANGLMRANAQWYIGRTLHNHTSPWCDDISACYSAAYAAQAATMSPRALAAKAAYADFERLRQWCDDQWSYVGVVVTATHTDTGVKLGNASLWGIESDAGAYLAETANDLASEALEQAAETRAALVQS